MGVIKSAAKRTRQQRQALANQQLVDRLNLVEREADRFEKALLEYAKESNWAQKIGHEMGGAFESEWLGPGNGPYFAQNALNPPKPTMANPDSGLMPVRSIAQIDELGRMTKPDRPSEVKTNE